MQLPFIILFSYVPHFMPRVAVIIVTEKRMPTFLHLRSLILPLPLDHTGLDKDFVHTHTNTKCKLLFCNINFLRNLWYGLTLHTAKIYIIYKWILYKIITQYTNGLVLFKMHDNIQEKWTSSSAYLPKFTSL